MMSPRSRLFSSASFGLIHAAVSHVSFVSGFGASCSQPLLAKRPSQTVGSGRNTSSSPAGAAGGAAQEPAAARQRWRRCLRGGRSRCCRRSCGELLRRLAAARGRRHAGAGTEPA